MSKYCTKCMVQKYITGYLLYPSRHVEHHGFATCSQGVRTGPKKIWPEVPFVILNNFIDNRWKFNHLFNSYVRVQFTVNIILFLSFKRQLWTPWYFNDTVEYSMIGFDSGRIGVIQAIYFCQVFGEITFESKKCMWCYSTHNTEQYVWFASGNLEATQCMCLVLSSIS